MRDAHAGMREIRTQHERLNRGLILAGRAYKRMEPTAEPTCEDVTQLINDKARELGYLEVGLAAYYTRYE